MSLLLQFAHGSPHGRTPLGTGDRSVDVVPTPREIAASTTRRGKPAVADVDAARRIGRTLLATVGVDDDDLARLEAEVDERVDVWAPSVRLRSRFDLMSAFVDVDDTIRDIEVVFTQAAATSSTVLLEWSATGHFEGAALLYDDELVEPTGAEVVVGGALSMSMRDGHRPTHIRCYYDRLALIEQLVSGARGRGLSGRSVKLPGDGRLDGFPGSMM